ncbi:response regulator transcription factor [Gracilimonas sp.]|uniref:response regulator transcription factor n=1 Tax=Gracilimonas sp. TaxID=1974203 RepID=UPI003BA9B1F0
MKQDKLNTLSHRELEVLQLVAEMKSSNEIAELLLITPKTVENHRSSIAKKLGLTGNNSVLRFGIAHSKRIKLLKPKP